MLSTEARSLLRRVRARVDDEWDQGAFVRENPFGPPTYCLVGLLRHEVFGGNVVKVEPVYREAIGALNNVLETATLNRPVGGLIYWNDSEGRTKEDVKDLIGRALQ